MDEVDFVVQVITHPAGFDLDLFAMLCCRPTDQGVYCVTYNPTGEYNDPDKWEECFEDPVEAARYFVAKRNEMKLGIDYEINMLRRDDVI